MNNAIAEARKALDRLRFSGDVSTGDRHDDFGLVEKLRSALYKNEIEVSSSLTPELARRLQKVCARLAVPETSIAAFIYPSPEVQAECFSTSADHCVVRFASGLVDLLSPEEFEFVAGHEIGHFLLSHGNIRLTSSGENPQYYVRKRYQEISADRIGLISCGSIDIAIKAMMKTMSGLSSQHLRFDTNAFIAQLTKSEPKNQDSEMTSTHPSILIRCRALLWFSMEGLVETHAQVDAGKLNRLNERVLRDFHRFVDRAVLKQKNILRTDVLLWQIAREIILSGSFKKSAQDAVVSLIGAEAVAQLKRFFSDWPKSEAEKIIQEKLKTARDNFEAIDPDVFMQEMEKISEIIKQAKVDF